MAVRKIEAVHSQHLCAVADTELGRNFGGCRFKCELKHPALWPRTGSFEGRFHGRHPSERLPNGVVGSKPPAAPSRKHQPFAP